MTPNGKAVQVYLSNEAREHLAKLPARARSALINELLRAFFAPDTMQRNLATLRALLIAAEFELEESVEGKQD